MPKITKITEQISNKSRVSIYIDGTFCKGLRKRTFKAMNLKVGDEITCTELDEKENYFWKQSYNEEAWEKEKVRLNRISEIVSSIDPRIEVQIVGFGADSTELIKEHPEEKGIPDINIYNKINKELILKIEVTGTERMRGDDYWIRPDKIEYAKNHPSEIVWTALHYAEPTELIRFIKHIEEKEYKTQIKTIKGADEIYCIFQDSDEEVYTFEEFKIEIQKLLE